MRYLKTAIIICFLSQVSIQVYSQENDYQLMETLQQIQLLDESVLLAHWNTTGNGAYVLHELTGEFHDDLDGYKDLLAERLRISGFYPSISHEKLSENKNIKLVQGKLSNTTATDFLTDNYEQVISSLDEKIENSSSDLVVQDVYISLKGALEFHHWKLTMRRD